MKLFSGFSVQIYAIDNGRVSMHLKDPHFNDYLPIIPSEVSYVNFTWSSGPKKYTYHFDRLTTSDATILKPPTVSIAAMGDVPKTPQGTYLISYFKSSLYRILLLLPRIQRVAALLGREFRDRNFQYRSVDPDSSHR